MSTLTVHRATHEHVPVVHGLIADAARELHDRGVDQWPHPFPEHIVRNSISRRDTFLAWQGTEPVGTLAIYWDDATFWGERPADAGYVHRLIVPTSARGHGLGARLLDWATDHVAAQGRQQLRLDCGRDNTRLRVLYERLGFRHVGDVDVTVPGAGSAAQPWPASLYQRPILSSASDWSS